MDIAANLAAVKDRIARAAERAGRSPAEILLVGISKTFPVERIRQAIAAGVPALGENRVQEAKAKIEALGHAVPWHLVGSLQTNKARDAVRLFDWIHSVDRAELARELDRRARSEGKVVRVLVEVNLGGEATKGGIVPTQLKALLEEIAPLSGIKVKGLMVIPPPADHPDGSRPWFRQLRELRETAAGWKLPGVEMADLSMGMSADFEVAIDEGATMVRVGTAIFGERK
ncbi:MAG: YggS family pyridoxal phosphate-dependent enzyme [candidate division NC10 bacterium]